MITELESLNVPVVAAIEGFAFGGGLEVALGAHFRVSSERAKLGLPEVNLGLLPGAGGTQRLPRVSGNEFAVHLMVTGAPVSASQAKKVNLVDVVVPASQNVFDAAVAFIQDKVILSFFPFSFPPFLFLCLLPIPFSFTILLPSSLVGFPSFFSFLSPRCFLSPPFI